MCREGVKAIPCPDLHQVGVWCRPFPKGDAARKAARRQPPMRGLLPSFLLLACVAGAQERPKFEDYPVQEIFDGVPAPVLLDNRAKRLYKTRITAASRQEPNFAGHYSFAQWGCGSNCAAGAVVDLETGEVLDPPYFAFIEPWMICGQADRTEFRPTSRLVLVTCGPEIPDEVYFVIEDGKFREVAFIPGNLSYRERVRRHLRNR